MNNGERLKIAAPRGELQNPVMDKLQQSGLRFTASKGRLLHGGRKLTGRSCNGACE